MQWWTGKGQAQGQEKTEALRAQGRKAAGAAWCSCSQARADRPSAAAGAKRAEETAASNGGCEQEEGEIPQEGAEENASGDEERDSRGEGCDSGG